MAARLEQLAKDFEKGGYYDTARRLREEASGFRRAEGPEELPQVAKTEAPEPVGRIRGAIRKTGVVIARVGVAVGVVGVAGIVTQAGPLSEADHNTRIEATTQFPPSPQDQIDKALLELGGSNFASENTNLTPIQQKAAEVIVFNTEAQSNRAAFVRAAKQTPTHRRLERRVDTALDITGAGIMMVVAGKAIKGASHIRRSNKSALRPQYVH